MGKNIKKMVARQERLEQGHEQAQGHGQMGGHSGHESRGEKQFETEKGGKSFEHKEKEHAGSGHRMGEHEKGKFKEEAQRGSGGHKDKKQD